MIRVDTISTALDHHDRACKKHSWEGYTAIHMLMPWLGETKELLQAIQAGRIAGKHGVVDESYDVVATLFRLAEALEHHPVDLPFLPDFSQLITAIDATVSRLQKDLNRC